MNTKRDPREIAETILERSVCTVQVGACLVDPKGRVVSWGWNHSGFDGFGMHAEDHCISRASRRRVEGSTIYVASKRLRNAKVVSSRPCPDCEELIRSMGIKLVWWRNGDGRWYAEDMV